MRADISAQIPDLITDVEDRINEARDYIRIAGLAANGIKGEVGAALARVMEDAACALLHALSDLKMVKGVGHAG